MADVIAVYNNPKDAALVLQGQIDQVVIRLDLKPGKWVIFGKTFIENDNDDDQNANAKLTVHDGDKVLDEARTRIQGKHGLQPGGGESWTAALSLQGILLLRDKDDTIDMRCATQSGSAQCAQLVAIRVDQLVPPIPTVTE